MIIYEDFIGLFVQNGRVNTWELFELILELAAKTPDSDSLIFANSSSMLKRKLSFELDRDSPDCENSRMEYSSDLAKSRAQVESFHPRQKSPLRENLNASNITHKGEFLFKDQAVHGDNHFFLNIPKKNVNKPGQHVKKSSRHFRDNGSRLHTKNKRADGVSAKGHMQMSQWSNGEQSQREANKETEIIKKCILNLLKFSLEDGLDLTAQILKFSFDSKKISMGKFYFLVLHQLRINHHYSIDVLANQ